MSSNLDELLALDALGLLSFDDGLDDGLDLDDAELASVRAELEAAASMIALTVEPIQPSSSARERLLAELRGPEHLAPFVERVASLFDLGHARIREILRLFDSAEGWTSIMPGAAFYDLDGGPALGDATAGLVRIASGIEFPFHTHRGEERVLVLQGEFLDNDGRQRRPGELVVMADGTAHGFTVVSARELLYAVVVREIEFEDGTRAP